MDILCNVAHPDLRNIIEQSRYSIINYAENEADVSAAVIASNAFGDESGKLSDHIYYGTISREIRSGTMADSFKQRTIELYKYFDGLGIKVNFLFSKQSFSKDDLELFD